MRPDTSYDDETESKLFILILIMLDLLERVNSIINQRFIGVLPITIKKAQSSKGAVRRPSRELDRLTQEPRGALANE